MANEGQASPANGGQASPMNGNGRRSWLRDLFGKRRSVSNAPDFSGAPLALGEFLHTDLHCHLIPGVDDGVTSLEEALEMIGRLRALGYTGSILTSHIYADLYPNSRETLTPGFEQLRAAVAEKFPDYALHLAAEYFTDAHFAACIASDDLLWFPGRDLDGNVVKCVLFEFGFHEAPMQAHDIVFKLQLGGYQPVLAHVERYPYWHNDLTAVEALHERGVWLTLNAASLAGAYGPETYAAALAVMERGWCRMVCSDAHGMRHIEALEAVGRSPAVQTWARSTSADLHRNLG